MADGRAGNGGDEVVEVGSDGAGVIVGGPWQLGREPVMDAWQGEGAGDGWCVGRLRCKVKGGGSFVAGRSQLQCRGVGGWRWGVVVGVLG